MENEDLDEVSSESNNSSGFKNIFENNKKLFIVLGIIVVLIIGMSLFNSGGSSDEESVTVTVEPEEIKAMTINSTKELKVKVSNDKNPKVEYESSDPNVISVDDDGTLKSLNYGTATITIKYKDNITKFENILVYDGEENVKLVAAVLPNKTLLMNVGDTYNISGDLTITPSNSKITKKEFTGDDDSVIKITREGEVIALREGNANITVNVNDKFNSTINVIVSSEVINTGLEVLPKEIILGTGLYKISKGEIKNVPYELKPNNATHSYLKWSSSNTEFVSVSQQGEVTGVKEGSSTITARSIDGVEGKVDIEVLKDIVQVESISVSNETIPMKKNKTYTLTPTVLPSDASNKSLKFESDDYRVISFDKSIGTSVTLYSHEAGTARVTITSDNGISKVVTVNVEDDPVSTQTPQEKPTNVRVKVKSGSNTYDAVTECGSTQANIRSTPSASITIEKDSGVNYVMYCYQKASSSSICVPNTQYSKGFSISSNGYLYKLRIRKFDYSRNEIIPENVSNYIDGASEYYINTTSNNVVNCSGTATTVLATGISINQSCPITMNEGETIQLNTLITPSNTTYKTVLWDTNNTKIRVSVGKVTALAGSGGQTATITARTTNGKTDTCEIRVNSNIVVPSTPTTPSTPTITGGSTKVFNYQDTTLTCTSSSSTSGGTKYYEFGYATSSGGTVSNWTSGTTSNRYTISKDAFLGTRYYKCRVYTKNGSEQSSKVESSSTTMTLKRVKINFDARGGQGGSTTLYAQYGSSKLYRDSEHITGINYEQGIPTPVGQNNQSFNGWYASHTGGTPIVDKNLNIISYSGWTSNGKWIITNTGDRNLYAQYTQNAPTLTTLNCPTIADKPYNGQNQTIDEPCPSGSTLVYGTATGKYVMTYTYTCKTDSTHTFSNNSGDSCIVTWKIVKSDTEVRLNDNAYSYNQGETVPTVSATATFKGTSYNLLPGDSIIRYYTDISCTRGETSAAPTAAGTYYVKAIVPETDNYNGSSSNCVPYTIRREQFRIDGFTQRETIKKATAIFTAASYGRPPCNERRPGLTLDFNYDVNRTFFCFELPSSDKCFSNVKGYNDIISVSRKLDVALWGGLANHNEYDIKSYGKWYRDEMGNYLGSWGGYFTLDNSIIESYTGYVLTINQVGGNWDHSYASYIYTFKFNPNNSQQCLAHNISLEKLY